MWHKIHWKYKLLHVHWIWASLRKKWHLIGQYMNTRDFHEEFYVYDWMTKTFPSMPLEYHIQDLVGSVVVELSNSCLKNGKTCKNQTEKNELNKKDSGFWHFSVSFFTQNRSWIFIFWFSWHFVIELVHIICIIILSCTIDVKITFNI